MCRCVGDAITTRSGPQAKPSAREENTGAPNSAAAAPRRAKSGSAKATTPASSVDRLRAWRNPIDPAPEIRTFIALNPLAVSARMQHRRREQLRLLARSRHPSSWEILADL